MVLLPLLLGALVASVLLAVSSPAGSTRHPWPWWSVPLVGLGMGVLAMVFSLFDGAEPASIPWFGLVFVGLGSAVVLRVTARMPIVSVTWALVVTSLFWATVVTVPTLLMVAAFFLPFLPLLAPVATGALVWLALRRRRAPKWMKIVLYVWVLAATLTLAYVHVFVEVLGPALDSGAFGPLLFAAIVLTQFVVQAMLLLFSAYGWIYHGVIGGKGGAHDYEPEHVLLPRRFIDAKPSRPVVLALLVVPGGLLLANQAFGLVEPGLLVAIVLTVAPLVEMRQREPAPLAEFVPV